MSLDQNILTALSLFSGIGGFCEGVKKAGFRVSGAVEFDKYATVNYRLNFPDVPLFEGDIHDFLIGDQFEEHLAKYANAGRIDMVFGGPPCQGYSQIGPRNIKDPRNELYKEFCRIVGILNPKIVLIENVPNMFMMKKGLFKDKLFTELQRYGYTNIGWDTLNSGDFGVPQLRKRVFIIAAKADLIDHPIKFSLDKAAALLKRRPVTVSQAIDDLPKHPASDSGVSLDYPTCTSPSTFQREMRIGTTGKLYCINEKLRIKEADYSRLSNHHTKAIQEKRLKLIKLLAPGDKADSLPKEVWNNARPEKWRRLHPNRPSHTILAQMHRDLSEWVHPTFDRWITVREAMRLQSFHDGFILETSEWQQLKQVGNAVPPLLAYVPAIAAKMVLTKFDSQHSQETEVQTSLCLHTL
jgi:DNA (cytosine-5)-methyltransferase 1